MHAITELLGDNKRQVVMLAASSLLSGLAEAGTLAVVAQVAASLATRSKHVDAHIGVASVHTSLGVLLAIGGGLAIARALLQIPGSYLPARIASEVQMRLRKGLFDGFTLASWSTQASDREGQLQELLGNQVAQASGGTIQATTLVTNLSAFLILLASALELDAKAAAIVLVVCIALFAVLRPLSVIGGQIARALSRAQMAQASAYGQAIRLAEETQVFGVGAAQRKQVTRFLNETRRLFFRAQLISRIVPNAYQSTVYLLLVGGLAAVYEFSSGSVTSLGAVVLLLVRAAAYGNAVQGSAQAMRQSLPYLERVKGAEARYLESAPILGHTALPRIERIAFEDVSFAYNADRPALEHVTFEIHEGEAIGVVGPSGAGKSTLSQLLLRLRLPTSGSYLVNGRPAEDFKADDWNRHFSYIPQTPHLIHATVAENITYYRDFTQEEIERAARLAGIHDEVLTWKGGYQRLVGPRADAVSGGQAQRICLARALVGRPTFLLLDEPTSAVDLKSERLIQESLLALKRELTLVIIAHRISTLDMCDRVMVILDGKLNAFEPFAELRETNTYYRSVIATGIEASAPIFGGHN